MGPTEAVLMELAWKHKQITVKQAMYHLGNDNGQKAYTTVMTILARLAEKGFLERKRVGRSFIYNPHTSRSDFIKERLDTINSCLKRNFHKKT